LRDHFGAFGRRRPHRNLGKMSNAVHG
jgi:hypothetical protein